MGERMRAVITALGVAFALATPSHGEVLASAPDGFTLRCQADLAATPQRVWEQLVRPQRWWSPEHTYSGSAANMSLEPEAGGRWRESWKGGEVLHGEVLAITPPEMLRLSAPLGPLQEMGVSAILTFVLAPNDKNDAALTVTFQVSGRTGLKLDAVSSPVNDVLCAQVERLEASLAG